MCRRPTYVICSGIGIVASSIVCCCIDVTLSSTHVSSKEVPFCRSALVETVRQMVSRRRNASFRPGLIATPLLLVPPWRPPSNQVECLSAPRIRRLLGRNSNFRRCRFRRLERFAEEDCGVAVCSGVEAYSSLHRFPCPCLRRQSVV